MDTKKRVIKTEKDTCAGNVYYSHNQLLLPIVVDI